MQLHKSKAYGSRCISLKCMNILWVISVFRQCFGGWDVYFTKYATRLNTRTRGWQICHPLIPGFLPRCSYILARHNVVI
jgi:hypothetical protein